MKSINTDTSVFTNEIKSLHQYVFKNIIYFKIIDKKSRNTS